MRSYIRKSISVGQTKLADNIYTLQNIYFEWIVMERIRITDQNKATNAIKVVNEELKISKIIEVLEIGRRFTSRVSGTTRENSV